MTLLHVLRLNETTSDDELIAACLDGDQAAWEMLIRRYSRLIYSVPLHIGLPEGDAADVFQTVCLALYRKLDTLRDQTRLAAWLLTTARRESLNVIRHRQAELGEPSWEEDGESDVPEIADLNADADLQRLEDSHLVRQAMDLLPDRCRQLLWHLYFDPSHPSYTDVARLVGIAPTAVGVNRSRCLERLQHILLDLGF